VRLRQISATPHPDGNRIDLSWVNPDPAGFPGVRVVRRTGTHPDSPGDGAVVADLLADGAGAGEIVQTAMDLGLKGETVYYYGFFPYPKGGVPDASLDPANRAAAMASSPYACAEQMCGLLPGIYHRYDAALAEEGPGPLRRFLSIPGGQLDLLYSQARSLLDAHDLDKVDGRLLPLLAQWIGWQTDYRRPIDAQRNEIRNAPAIYHTIGIIPTVEATVKRLLGWGSRTKEFVHNVVRSNQPERLNLWALQGDGSGFAAEGGLLSLDFAYEGRPAAAVDADGATWLFYHTLRAGRWEIWHKVWAGGEWSPSQPLVANARLNRHPAAVCHQGQLWLFWDAYDPGTQAWRLQFRTRDALGRWSPIKEFGQPERRMPAAADDGAGGLWLFWLEKRGGFWQVCYNRHNGTEWQLASPAHFPCSGGFDPRVEDDLFVLSKPADATQPLWVFWARRAKWDGDGQTRWQIAYRHKANLNPQGSGWSAISILPKGAGLNACDDREPAPRLDGLGRIELFWSSTRDGSWSVWRQLLEDGSPEPLTRAPYDQRAPLPVPAGVGLQLVYRSNESLPYASTVYAATQTLDARYSGSTTVPAQNLAKTAWHREFKDFQTYTYQTGKNGERGDSDWYGRDTIGIYLTPDTEDAANIRENRHRLRSVLPQFLPAPVRAVFIIELASSEAVYTYEFPQAEEPRVIGESAFDTLSPLSSENYGDIADSRVDMVPDWTWLRSWSEDYPAHRGVDFAHAPVSTPYRTWHTGLAT